MRIGKFNPTFGAITAGELKHLRPSKPVVYSPPDKPPQEMRVASVISFPLNTVLARICGVLVFTAARKGGEGAVSGEIPQAVRPTMAGIRDWFKQTHPRHTQKVAVEIPDGHGVYQDHEGRFVVTLSKPTLADTDTFDVVSQPLDGYDTLPSDTVVFPELTFKRNLEVANSKGALASTPHKAIN